jgi:hypothetical protein
LPKRATIDWFCAELEMRQRTAKNKTAAAANMRRHGMAAAVYTQEAEEECHKSRAAETELLAQFYN